MHNAVIALIRTFVPTLVGLILSFLVAQGVTLDPELEGALTAGFLSLAVAGYYALVTFLERKVHPAFGWLLGVAKAPAYAHKAPPAPAPVVVDAPEGDHGYIGVGTAVVIAAIVIIVIVVIL